jgi:hypothetical protein
MIGIFMNCISWFWLEGTRRLDLLQVPDKQYYGK